jgi:phosphoglycolate phosphatase-like HAD superfamily hydrolase
MRYLFIFDLYNTLVRDNDLAVTSAMNQVLARSGRNMRVDIEYVRTYQAKLMPFSQYFRTILPDLSEEEIGRLTLETKEICEKYTIRKYVRAMEGAEEVLQQIRKNGDTAFVLSFSTVVSIEFYLKVAGLARYADRALGIENRQEIHGDGDPGKVKAEILKEHLGGRYERVFMIGDSIYDMKAGRSVGATNIYFTKTREVLDIADYCIDDLREIINVAYSA